MNSKPVVVGVDGTAAALHAVRWAAECAVRTGLLLRIIHAYKLPLGFPTGVTEEESVLNALRLQGRQWLSEARDAATEIIAPPSVETELAAMPASAALVRESENASLLVLGNKGRNTLTGLLAGSTSLALASQAHCPLVLVRANGADGNPRTGPIVVGVDGTEASEAALAFAFAEASEQGASLVALHAWAESAFETALAAGNAPLDWARHRQLAEEALAERLAGAGTARGQPAPPLAVVDVCGVPPQASASDDACGARRVAGTPRRRSRAHTDELQPPARSTPDAGGRARKSRPRQGNRTRPRRDRQRRRAGRDRRRPA